MVRTHEDPSGCDTSSAGPAVDEADVNLTGEHECRYSAAANHGWKRSAELSDVPTETPVLDLLATMTAASMEASRLDAQTLMLVRIAALVAVNAPPSSYLLNLGAAGEIGVDGEQVRDVLAAVAPIVGTARVASAVGNMVRALGLAELAAEQQLAEGT
jgi:4-carboxymuconolactone decarboxylase